MDKLYSIERGILEIANRLELIERNVAQLVDGYNSLIEALSREQTEEETGVAYDLSGNPYPSRN